MPKRATQVILTDQEQEALVQVTKRHRSEQQHVLRARIVLAAAEGRSNAQIARELTINVDTARLWRDRWVGLHGIDLDTLGVAERLQDAPRPGTPPKFTAEQRCQIATLACEAPRDAGRPISQWTGREIADELQARGIVEQISPRHASYLLKKGAATAPLPVLVDGGGGRAAGGANCGRVPGLCTSRRTSQARGAHDQPG